MTFTSEIKKGFPYLVTLPYMLNKTNTEPCLKIPETETRIALKLFLIIYTS